MNIPHVSLPFLVPFTHLDLFEIPKLVDSSTKKKTGVDKDKNGRETGERTDCPPVPSVLYLSAFEPCDGTKGGTFSNASILGVRAVEHKRSLHRVVYRN